MTEGRTLRRIATGGASALLAATLLTSALANPAAAAPAATDGPQPGVIVQPFYADSGDKCPMGHTKGFLGWRVFSPGLRFTVDVKGTVVDRPLPDETDTSCGEDRRSTQAIFTAYSLGFPVARTTARADNARVDFSTFLNSFRRIDRVTVQVCRTSTVGDPSDYCGKLQEYRPPFVPTD